MFSFWGSANTETPPPPNIYGFTAKTIDGEEISMSKFRGKVVVIVNVASKLNYTQLVQLDEKYKEQGLEIVGFPCNQFGGQEPGTNEEIKAFAAGYNAKFQMMDKIDVNFTYEHPLYTYLKAQLTGTLINAIKWNFAKFVIDRNGVPIQRFGPKDEPNSMIPLIERLLAGEAVEKVLDPDQPPPAA